MGKAQTLEMGRKFQCAVPHIRNHTVYKTRGSAVSHHWARETTDTKTHSVKYVSPPVPSKKVTFTATLHMVQLDIPFVMTMKYRFRQCSCAIDGSLRLKRLNEIK